MRASDLWLVVLIRQGIVLSYLPLAATLLRGWLPSLHPRSVLGLSNRCGARWNN